MGILSAESSEGTFGNQSPTDLDALYFSVSAPSIAFGS